MTSKQELADRLSHFAISDGYSSIGAWKVREIIEALLHEEDKGFDAGAHLKAGGKVTYPSLEGYMMIVGEKVSVFNRQGEWQHRADASDLLRDDLKPYEEPARERGWYWCGYGGDRRPLWWNGADWRLAPDGQYTLNSNVTNINPQRIVEDMS